MSFDKYFAATECAFADEHDEFSKRVRNIGMKWDELSSTDEETCNLVKELSQLKLLLRRGHLQILRTKEECIHMKLRNAQLAFHVRQLQAEIRRFLPYTSVKNEPSTEYVLSIDKTEIIEKAKKQVAADDKLNQDISDILKQWHEITDLQTKVFNEERQIQQADSQQFKVFSNDYYKQNEMTHKLLDKVHSELLHNYLMAERASKSLLANRQSTQKGIDTRITSLSHELEGLGDKLERKLAESKVKMDKKLEINTKLMKEGIKRQEAYNASAAIDAAKMQKQLSDDLFYFQDKVEELKRKEKKINNQKEFNFAEAEQLISKLESEYNAIISAAAAVPSLDAEHHINLINSVAHAVSEHVDKSKSSSMLDSQAKQLGSAIKKSHKK
ncbi:hypothetical protein TVAG_064690 [Trichomonas vaginalis G3]|uniref:Uncharacterized protein n=1 Tax=Trichomonas vaginalis (strain ATCC PRA-98 / G3) TaxID=412133 RepID=A2EHE3_TRIV3|nr:hypothetical protein TVAGG3_0350240 [Trichomonas vaginalis G3]EAY07921.1 hypothetical protein TVAG_064690 [Trichomonas vaginalis G3]KAI5531233.1 hypothetical protein TVAGG3_0350240 [Trichomonas vaginalis G3]|eukprot:XP_001320144.1 hypothetical protein [Trichomonas vaginalis G3]